MSLDSQYANMKFNHYTKEQFLEHLAKIVNSKEVLLDSESIVDEVLVDNSLPIGKEFYIIASDFFDIERNRNLEFAVCDPNLQYEDIEIEGPYGGAFRDEDDLFHYKEGYWPSRF